MGKQVAAFRRHTFPPLRSSISDVLGAAAWFLLSRRGGGGELLLLLARLLSDSCDPQMLLGEIKSRQNLVFYPDGVSGDATGAS